MPCINTVLPTPKCSCLESISNLYKPALSSLNKMVSRCDCAACCLWLIQLLYQMLFVADTRVLLPTKSMLRNASELHFVDFQHIQPSIPQMLNHTDVCYRTRLVSSMAQRRQVATSR